MPKLLECLFVAMFVWFVAPSAGAENLAIPGAGPPERLMRKLADAFNALQAEHRVSVPPSSGVAGALLAIEVEGAALARFPRPLDEAETLKGLHQVVYARDAVVFVVGEAARLRQTTTAQLVDIYSGKITS